MLDIAKIKRLREKLGLSMAQAAKAAGMASPQAWNKIENGDGESVTLKTVGKIAKALSVKARDLLK